jgi:alkylhydroperoxidase family enzyme
LARQLGYAEPEIEALEPGRDRSDFEPAVRLALEYAERMTRDAHRVTSEFFAEMKKHYSDSEILEITCVAGLANYWNRFTTALRIDLSGTDEPYDPPAPE